MALYGTGGFLDLIIDFFHNFFDVTSCFFHKPEKIDKFVIFFPKRDSPWNSIYPMTDPWEWYI